MGTENAKFRSGYLIVKLKINDSRSFHECTDQESELL